ncbi:MAG: hypothetical protein ABEI86_11570 [Halobacteriaceae archaeon]
MDADPPSPEILEYSPADRQTNAEVYESANEHMLSVIENDDTDEYMHITGEMRAITDPKHRRVVNKLYNRHGASFDMLFRLPKEFECNVNGILKYNQKAWSGTEVNWKDHLEAYDLIKNEKIRLYNTPKLEPIHYTVYGDEYILLQAKHDHLEHEKAVWLLKSEEISQKCKRYAEKRKRKSTQIHPNRFRQYISTLSSSFALNILLSAKKNGGSIKVNDINAEMRDPYLKNLSSINFINRDNRVVRITNEGEGFLNHMLN